MYRRVLEPVFSFLNRSEGIWHLLVGVGFNRIIQFRVQDRGLLESAVIESSHRQRDITLPTADQQITFFTFTNGLSGRNHGKVLGRPQGEFVSGSVTKGRVGIPVVTCYECIVSAATVHYGIISAIFETDRVVGLDLSPEMLESARDPVRQ